MNKEITLHIGDLSIPVINFDMGVDVSTQQDYTACSFTDGKFTLSVPMEPSKDLTDFVYKEWNHQYLQDVINKWWVRQ